MKMQSALSSGLSLIVGVAIGVATYVWYSHPPEAAAPIMAGDTPVVLYWYDPMRPDQHFDAPGRSPFMDMDLVPKYATDKPGAVSVRIDPRMVQNLGMRTAPVTRGTFYQRVDTTARIEVDERSRTQVFVRAPGWVEVLKVRAEGERVARGQVLAEVYSPSIATAKGELLIALESDQGALIATARAQLKSLGVGAKEIAAVESSRQASRRTSVTAPVSGYVMTLGVREGSAVGTDAPMFELSDHQHVWVIAEVPERESAWITSGRSAQVRVAARPGTVFEGEVDYVYPDLDAATRTRRVRVVLANADGDLHPGMYAEVTVYGGGRRDQLLVPTEAVIRTGERTMVMVADGDGRFTPVAIKIGDERAGETVVLEGLQEGVEVVTSGQFLIDSEASLQGAYRRLSGSQP